MSYLFDVEKQRHEVNHGMEKVAMSKDLPNILCLFDVFLYRNLHSYWITIDDISFARMAIEKTDNHQI
jgi:hypothetical protein